MPAGFVIDTVMNVNPMKVAILMTILFAICLCLSRPNAGFFYFVWTPRASLIINITNWIIIQSMTSLCKRRSVYWFVYLFDIVISNWHYYSFWRSFCRSWEIMELLHDSIWLFIYLEYLKLTVWHNLRPKKDTYDLLSKTIRLTINSILTDEP